MTVGTWNLSKSKILEREEVAKILAISRDIVRDYVFLVVAANTALRVSEVCHLKVANHVGNGELVAQRRKKARLTDETIPITPAVEKLLHKWIHVEAHLSAGWIFPGDSRPHSITRKRGGASVVIASCPGGHLSIREIQRRWDSYLEKAGLAKVGRGIHTLRHYAVTQFYLAHPGDLRAAQVFAGHSSIGTTESYAHVLDLREKVDKVKPTL